jgi:branched-chain amino acid transport system ATP-binding protein
VLKVKALNVHYGAIQALIDVSLDVGDGELVTLIGSNGAGKTTFMMALSGILRPTSGVIEFCGNRTDRLPSDVIFRLGIVQVPQGRMLFPDMTTLENLELGAYYAPNEESRSIDHKLEQIYGYFSILRDRTDQKAGTLSGGEQQMLAIGRALMADPKLLLMDEPSAGVAPIMVEQLSKIITNLHREGLSMLLVEQNAHLALDLADRGYVLQTGRIIARGQTADLAESELVRKAYLGM